MKGYNEVILDQGEKTNSSKFLNTGIDSFDNKYQGLSTGINLFCAFHGMGLTMLASLITGKVSNSKCLYITLDRPASNIANRIKSYSTPNPINIYFEEEIYPAAKILKFLSEEISRFPLIVIDTFQLIDFDISYQSFVRQLQDIASKNDSSIILLYTLQFKHDYEGGYIEPTIDYINPHSYLKLNCSALYYLHRPGYFGITEDELGNNVEKLAMIRDLKEEEIRDCLYEFGIG